MKKFRIVLLAFLAVGVSTANAQFFAGGSLNVNCFKTKTDGGENKGVGLGVAPELGYRISDKFEFGIGGDVVFSKNKSKYNYDREFVFPGNDSTIRVSYSSDSEGNGKTYSGFVYLQYNALQINKFNLAFQLMGSYTKTKDSSKVIYDSDNYDDTDFDSEFTQFGASILPTFEYVLNDNIRFFSRLSGIAFTKHEYEANKAKKIDIQLVNDCSFGVKYIF